MEQSVALGRVELEVVDLHNGEILVRLGEQRIATDKNVGCFSYKLVLAIEGVGGGLSGDQLVIDKEGKTVGWIPGDLVEIPLSDAAQFYYQSPDLTRGTHDQVHQVFLVEKSESLSPFKVAAVGQKGGLVFDFIDLHEKSDGKAVRAFVQISDALSGLIRAA